MVRRAARTLTVLFLAALGLVFAETSPLGPPPEPQDTAALGLRLRRLATLGTVLVITAHPDDENNAVLTALSRGLGVHTALLTATRGEGGQNAIGPELGESLGLLRSEELAAIHRRDGVGQYFARAYDFGYSFSVEETYAKWGRDEILEDFVRVIRAVRPDVIVTLPRDARGGGQHHQAAGRLAAIAFHAAADGVLFPPEAVGGLEPWQTRRIYEGRVGMGGAAPEGAVAEGEAVVETGTSDPVLATTWFDFGGRSRALHRTQGMGAPKAADSGTAARYRLIDSEPSVEMPGGHALLDRIHTSWSRLLTFTGPNERPAVAAAVPTIEGHIRAARAAFDAGTPADTLVPLRAALALVRRLREEAMVSEWHPRAKLEILTRLEPKETDLMEAIALAHGLRLEAVADDDDVVPGQEFTVAATLANEGPEPLKLEDVVVHAPEGWSSKRTAGEPRALAPRASASMKYSVAVGTRAEVTRSLGRKGASADRYEMAEEERTSRVFPPAPVFVRLFFTSGGLLVGLDRPLPVSVAPLFSARFLTPAAVLRAAVPKGALDVRVAYHGRGPATASCRLEAPESWTVAPPEVPLRFATEGEEQTVRFEIAAPEGVVRADARLRAWVSHAGTDHGFERQIIDYSHVERRPAVRDAEMRVRVLDVSVPPRTRVGHVFGAGDHVAEALEQIGAEVDPLTPDDLAAGDLRPYSAIVLCPRAYHVRADLKTSHPRLLQYVNEGGHLVVQYHRGELDPFVPYPARATTQRITDENAELRFLLPAHPLLNAPNTIGPADFQGWVQERGLYFLNATDPRYEDLLAATDPFPENPGEKKGMLVTTRVGAGRWTYVALGLWRQIDAGVPGAYRILANLVGQPRTRS